MIDYVKRIKKCDWEKKESLTVSYLSTLLEEIESRLNHESCESADYLNELFNKAVRHLAKDWKVFPSKGQVTQAYLSALKEGFIKKNVLIESMITVKPTRSNSGELETTTTLPGNGISCKYDCAMCPNQPGIARSYLSSEGSVVLGIIEGFNAFQQCLRRFIQYEYKMGHTIDKVLHILLGGTFHSYDEEVIKDYITKLYYCGNVYKDFSIRCKGKFVPYVEEWLKGNPFANHTSVSNGLLSSIASQLRPMKSLEEEKEENTYSTCGRITGIVIETRPDQISYKTMYDMRKYGITRVQLGIQHTESHILKIMDRKHDVTASIKALKYLRDNGFKVDGHLMPNCPGSTNETDLLMFKKVFTGQDLQLDYCKIYICLDVPYTKIRLWKEKATEMIKDGKLDIVNNITEKMQRGEIVDEYIWKDRAETDYDEFLKLLIEGIKLIPPWVRLNRFQRDFPEACERNLGLGFVSKTLKSNLQQICMENLEKLGLKSADIRSREVRKRIFNSLSSRAKTYIRVYKANDGYEFFISVEVPDSSYENSTIMGLIRLRIPDWDYNKVWKGNTSRAPYYYLPVFKNKATLRVRELHVYGTLQSSGEGNSQHKGIGKYLLTIAEYLAYYYKMQQIAIISGVGVQDYYRKNGYILKDDYMVKVPSVENQAYLFGNKYGYNDFKYCFDKLTSRSNYSCSRSVEIEHTKSYNDKQTLLVIKYKNYTYKFMILLTFFSIFILYLFFKILC